MRQGFHDSDCTANDVFTSSCIYWGRWELNGTLKLAAALRQDSRNADLESAVNLPARQLNEPELVDTVKGALQLWAMDPALFQLEITETAHMSDPAAAFESLTALKNLGVGLAVADFGTGYSSLTYLKKLPIKELKINRSFVGIRLGLQ